MVNEIKGLQRLHRLARLAASLGRCGLAHMRQSCFLPSTMAQTPGLLQSKHSVRAARDPLSQWLGVFDVATLNVLARPRLLQPV